MSRFVTYQQVYDNKMPEDFGVSKIEGTSMTIPGQGSDLSQIIASIVKLPPLDERNFDVPSGVEPDMRSLAVKTDLDALYLSEGKNLAEDAKERQNARKAQKNADTVDAKEKERSDADAKE